MDRRQILGLVGSAILFVGVFAPLVSVPIVGKINYIGTGERDGVLIVALALTSAALCLARSFKALWFTGIASLVILSFTFIAFQGRFSALQSQMDKELAGNPFRAIADVAMSSVQLEWGWAVLLVGTLLVLAAAAIKPEELNTSRSRPQLSTLADSIRWASHNTAKALFVLAMLALLAALLRAIFLAPS